ncbi:tetratricopeptide repeat-containing sensor histidine kinase [Chitinophagaceae bacterium MMS25-I14]
MQRLLLSVIVCCILPFCCAAQINDHVYQLLPDTLKPADRNHITWKEQSRILQTAFYYSDPSDSVAAQNLDKLALGLRDLVQKSSDKQMKIQGLSAIASYFGNFYYREDGFKRSLPYNNEIIELIHNDTAYRYYLTYALVGRALYYESVEDYENTAQIFDEALSINTKANDSAGIALVCSQSYLIYLNLGLYQQALSYEKMALKYALSEKKAGIRAWFFKRNAKTIIAEIYLGWYEKGGGKKEYADSAVTIADDLLYHDTRGNVSWHARYYFIKGYVSFSEGDFRQALSWFDSSLKPEYWINNAEITGRGCPLAYKALCLIKLGNRQEGFKMLRQNKDVDDIRDLAALVYTVLAQDAKDNGDWKNAFLYAEKARDFRDSMDQLSQRGKIFEINQKYAVAEKETEIKTLENKNIQRGRQRDLAWSAVAVAVLLLLIAALLFYLNNKKQQLKRLEAERAIEEERKRRAEELVVLEANMLLQQNEAVVAQRTRISEDMHDDVVGSLVALRYYLQDMKQQASGNEDALQMLTSVEEEVTTIYGSTREYMHNLSNSIKSLEYNLVDFLWDFSAQISGKTSLKIHLDADRNEINRRLSTVQHKEMYYIIKEAITNTIKYAHADRMDIMIRFSDDMCFFSIGDDGRGFSSEHKGTGLGLQSMQRRIGELHGKLTISSGENGTKISGSFPV